MASCSPRGLGPARLARSNPIHDSIHAMGQYKSVARMTALALASSRTPAGRPLS